MVTLLVIVGLLVAAFVGFNIGGSSTGVAFGPAVGSRLVRKATAGALFSVFVFLGAWTVGRNVIVTMSEGIVPAAQFTPWPVGRVNLGMVPPDGVGWSHVSAIAGSTWLK